MTPSLTPPDLTGVTVAHQAGSGRAVTHGGVYPLGGMDFSHAPSGRDVITLKADVGAFQLSGDQADEVAPGRWLLRIDHTALLSVSPANGESDMVMREAPPTYVSLSCACGSAAILVRSRWSGAGTGLGLSGCADRLRLDELEQIPITTHRSLQRRSSWRTRSG